MRYEDELKGKGKQVKGSTEEQLGKLTGNRNLQDRGNREQAEGHVQEKFGRAKRKVGEAFEDLSDEIAG